MMPLSEEERCRLCLSSSKNFVNLFDQNDRPHLVVDKLRHFVNLNIHPQDKNYCSNRVCRSCVMNLDFCIQYVDRCRRVNELMLQGENPDNIVATVTSDYPYLYKSDHMAMMPAAPMSQNENPQTVPFQMGQFFGPTADFVVPEGGGDIEAQNTNAAGTNVPSIKYNTKDAMDNNMVVEVEPNAILTPNAAHNFKRSSNDLNADHQNSTRNKKMRKILPKQQLSISGGAGDPTTSPLCHPSNAVKTSNGLFMMPVTIVTQCKTCKASIKATNVTDIQDHVCFDAGNKKQQPKCITCTEKGCNKKFYAQVTLRYHLKHYHSLGKNNLKSKIISASVDDQDPESAT